MISALAIVVAPVLALIPFPISFRGCPQVFEVRAPATRPGFNVVFVPAGFTTPADLENFRCAVAVLASQLLEDPVWKTHACQVGLYRMDLRDTERGIGLAAGCSDAECVPTPLDVSPWPNGCPVTLGKPSVGGAPLWPNFFAQTYSAHFEVQHCSADLCRFTWPSASGQATLLDVVDRCAPPAQAIVVIANSVLKGGGGDASPVATGPGLAVITVDDIATTSAWRRLAHELGHVAGLLDEYGDEDANATAMGNYVCGRNVFRPPDPGDSGTPCGAPYWEASCSDHEATDCSPDPAAKCQTVVDSMCTECPVQAAPEIALHEGAFGQTCGYFRSERICLMSDYSAPPCQVCEGLIDSAIDRAAGLCIAHVRHYKLRVRPKVEWDMCPTPPTPPIPQEGAMPLPSGWEPLLCGRTKLPFAAMYADVVTREGLKGEVAARTVWLELEPGAAPKESPSIGYTADGERGPRRLALRIGGREVSPTEWQAEVRRLTSSKTPPAFNVVDDVTGARWTSDAISLDVLVPP